MYISINWIKDFVDLEGIDVEKLIYKFSSLEYHSDSKTVFKDPNILLSFLL